MNIIELHILQSFPVSCLNRDDLGSPKSAYFGGVRRARLSSQCLKRAQRELFKEYAPEFAQGERTKLLTSAFKELIAKHDGVDEKLAETLAAAWGKLDAKKKDVNGNSKATTLTFLSPEEMEVMLQAALSCDPGDKKLAEKAMKALKGATVKDAADIAMFGRMVADNPSLTVAGAAMYSHALSTHRAEPEMDFYAAVDDLQSDDETGAGMTGVLEFNSACYYRYVAVNLDLMAENLKGLTDKEMKKVLDAFLRSALETVPSARRYSMNASTRPGYVMGLRRSSGHPLQLVNAFEQPVSTKGGYLSQSKDALTAAWNEMQEKWGMKADCRVEMPDVSENEFVSKLLEF